MDTVDTPKVASAAAAIAGLNPMVKVVAVPEDLTAANALDVVAPYDIVVDGSDNFPTKYLLDDACSILGKPLVYSAISGRVRGCQLAKAV